MRNGLVAYVALLLAFLPCLLYPGIVSLALLVSVALVVALELREERDRS